MAGTIAGFLAAARGRIDRLDARLLVEHVCGLTHAQIIADPERPLSADEASCLDGLLERRAAGEPLAYLVGQASFRGLPFAVSSAVLIPRPETEELVDCALDRLRGLAKPRCVDLGTGSGVVAVSLKLECPAATVLATDLSPDALAVAGANAAALGAAVEFRQGSWFAPLAEEFFDLIVSNPPYVADGDPHLAQGGLPFEPLQALTDGVAGGDGLACIREIVAGAGEHLLPGGWLLFEHGYHQGEGCRNLLHDAGFKCTFTQADLAGIDRISGGCRP